MVSLDGDHRDAWVLCGETCDVAGVVGDDGAAPEPDCSSDDECIDRQLTPRPRCGEQVAGDTCHPCTGGYDLREPAGKETIDRLVGPSSAVELHEHSRRDPDRNVAGVRGSHGGPHQLVACDTLVRASEC